MPNTHLYRLDLDPPFEDVEFWETFGSTRKPIIKNLLPYETDWPLLRYMAGRHESFEHVMEVCQIRDLVPLPVHRSVAESWAREVDHGDISAEPISYANARYQEIIIADVVCVTALYEFAVSNEPYQFRVQNFLFPGDARFDLLRLLAPGNPDRLGRAELGSTHAQLLNQAEEWSF